MTMSIYGTDANKSQHLHIRYANDMYTSRKRIILVYDHEHIRDRCKQITASAHPLCKRHVYVEKVKHFSIWPYEYTTDTNRAQHLHIHAANDMNTSRKRYTSVYSHVSTRHRYKQISASAHSFCKRHEHIEKEVHVSIHPCVYTGQIQTNVSICTHREGESR